MLKWPDAASVDRAVRRWASRAASEHPEVRRIGYFGSYARGDWGPGSDLDLVIVIERSNQPFDRRTLAWDASTLPVPADLVVYTLTEWEALQATRFGQTLSRETVWVLDRSSAT